MGNTSSTPSLNRTELMVYGFIRKCQNDSINRIPSQLYKLIFQYYQIVNIHGIGLNQFGCLGLGHTNSLISYQKLESIENIVISQIYKGFQSFLFLNYQNQVYATGNNIANQLDISNDSKSISTPTIMKFFKKNSISIVSNGIQSKHTFIKLSNNKLYAFGNNTYGQIPQISKTNHTVTTPKEIKYDHDKYNIVNIECGEDFSLFLTETGHVFGCGSNIYGQLGLGNEQKEITDLTKIEGLNNIIDIQCGNQHSLFLDDKGAVFGVGYNLNGQLGISATDNDDKNKDSDYISKFIYSPQVLKVGNDKRIKSIRCGAKHSGALDIDGQIYLSGANRGGQIGIGSDKRDVFEMVTPEKLQNIKVDSFDCGSRHTVLLTDTNVIYTFGFNQYQQCSVVVKGRYIFEPYLLKKSEIGINKGSIIQLIAGSYSTLIVTN